MKINFSERSSWPQEANALSALLDEKKKAGAVVLDLTESNPTRAGFNFSLELPAAIPPYEPDPHGLFGAREAVANYYGAKGICVNPADIFLTAGTSEAYNFIFRLLTNPGDSILVPEPGYPLFDFLVDLNDIHTHPWFSPEKAKLLVAVNPNNPTGHFLSKEEIASLNQLLKNKQMTLVSDEVFLDYAFDEGFKPQSLAANEEVLTFTLSGISKILGLPQMKLSWIVVSGPADLKKEAIARLEIIADTFLSVNTPAQAALPQWMKRQSEITGKILERVRENYTYFQKKFGPRVLPAQGGWYACLKLGRGVDEEKHCLKLLAEKNILAHPGYFFNFKEDILVLSLLVPHEKFKEALNSLL